MELNKEFDAAILALWLPIAFTKSVREFVHFALLNVCCCFIEEISIFTSFATLESWLLLSYFIEVVINIMPVLNISRSVKGRRQTWHHVSSFLLKQLNSILSLDINNFSHFDFDVKHKQRFL